MSEIKKGWLTDENGNKFAPKTITDQVQTGNGVKILDYVANLFNTFLTDTQEALGNKSDSDHNHDERYNTRDEIGTLLDGQVGDIMGLVAREYVAKGNIAVLTGNITLNKHSDIYGYYDTVNVNYPNGFTKDNCVVISAMEILSGATRTGFIPYLSGEQSALSRTTPTVTMNDTNIVIGMSSASENTLSYKVLLYKYA